MYTLEGLLEKSRCRNGEENQEIQEKYTSGCFVLLMKEGM